MDTLKKVDPMFLSMFANGDYDLLYEEADRERALEARISPATSEPEIRLQAERQFAVIQKISKREGFVVWSNCIRKGARVRSRVPWAFAVKPRNTWSGNTLVAPRTLLVIPDRPVVA